MEKFYLLITFVLLSTESFTQSYLGWTTQQVNFRSGPETTYGIIKSLEPETPLFIISSVSDNGFYNVIDIASNQEGFIHKSYVKFGEKVKKNEQGMFEAIGISGSQKPTLQIFNNTDIALILKLNANTYSFEPKQKRTITISTGKCDYRASAPGVIPDVGTEYIQSSTAYSWEFYIVTKRH